MSVALFILILKTTDPYLAHLAGINEPQTLLPLTLPYKAADRPMFSEMSFKCRSTSSFSSYTLVNPNEDTLYTLYPTRPEKTYGLGIYAPKTAAASFLMPRPSLKAIRSQASLGHRPTQCSPLPPLPDYHPEKYKDMPAMHRSLPPPRRAYTLKRRGSKGTLRIVPHSSATQTGKTVALDRKISKESLSSVYSRSVSGASPEPHTHPGALDDPRRNMATSSTPAVRRSPLSTMRVASNGYPVILPKVQPRRTNQHPANPIGHTLPMQARLPLTRAVSTFVNVQDWTASKDSVARPPAQRNGSWAERCNLPPLPVSKTRIQGSDRS